MNGRLELVAHASNTPFEPCTRNSHDEQTHTRPEHRALSNLAPSIAIRFRVADGSARCRPGRDAPGQAASDSQKDEDFLPEKVALDAIAQRLKETVYKHQ